MKIYKDYIGEVISKLNFRKSFKAMTFCWIILKAKKVYDEYHYHWKAAIINLFLF